ncbi:uncharacterized protein KZ484_002039 [Pholidichthys leucotaenia]
MSVRSALPCSDMTRLDQLKVLVNERLTAAAEEILGAVERVLVDFMRDVYVCRHIEEDTDKEERLLPLSAAALKTEQREQQEEQEQEEEFPEASHDIGQSEAKASIPTVYTETSGMLLRKVATRPEFLDYQEHWPTQLKGRQQDSFQDDDVSCLKPEQSTQSSSLCYDSQTETREEGGPLFPYASTEWRETIEEADGNEESGFYQRLCTDSGPEDDTCDNDGPEDDTCDNDGPEDDTLDNEMMETESRGSDSCPKTAASETKNKQTEKKPMTNPFTCKLCKESFHHKNSLMAHLKTHGESSLQFGPHKEEILCHICAKTFSTKSHLKRHMLIHTGQKPHCCNECGRRFARAECLRVHMAIHTVERPYVCGVCKKDFRQRSNLLAHMKKHSGEKPYRCNICSKMFADKKVMMRHTTIHTRK